jgi:WD40 repeat protein
MKKLLTIVALVCLSVTSLVLSQTLLQFPFGNNMLSSRIDWQDNGEYLAVSYGNSVSIINGTTQQVVHTLSAMPELVTAVKWSRDDQRLAIATGLEIQIWVTPWNTSQVQPSQVLTVPNTKYNTDYGIATLDWHPTLNLLLGFIYPVVHIWNLDTGQVQQTKSPGKLAVVASIWSSDGQEYVEFDVAGAVLIYPVSNGIIAERPNKGGEFSQINGGLALAWHPTLQKLAAGSGYGVVAETITTHRDLSFTWERAAQNSPVLSLAWNPVYPDILASGDEDGLVTVFQTPYMDILHQWQSDAPVTTLDWNPSGQNLVYSKADGYGFGYITPFLPFPSPTPIGTPTF